VAEQVIRACVVIEPLFMAMTSTHVIVASREAIYSWQFTTSRSLALSHVVTSQQRKDGREK